MVSRRNLFLVLLLVVASSGLQALLIARAVTPAPDCVRFVGVAQRFEQQGFVAGLRSQSEQPLFSICVLAVRDVLARGGVIAPYEWGLAAQIAAALPLIVAVIPLYTLTYRRFGEHSAVAASATFVLLPAIARLGADGIADSLHLAFVVTAVWAAATYFERRQIVYLVLAGGLTGLALLTRAESLVLVAAIPLTTVVWWWRSKKVERDIDGATSAVEPATVFAPAISYLLAVTAVWGAVCVTAGVHTPHQAFARLRGLADSKERPLNDVGPITPPVPYPLGEGDWTFGRKDPSQTSRDPRALATIAMAAALLVRTSQGWVLALALCGCIAQRRHFCARDLLLGITAALWAGGLLLVSARCGYVVGRHVVPIVVLLLPWAGQGAVLVSQAVARGLNDLLARARIAIGPRELAAVQFVALALLVGAQCAVNFQRPMHDTRTPHRQAAQWLSSAEPGSVLDTQGLTALFSARRTFRGETAIAAMTDPALKFVVVERTEITGSSPRAKSFQRIAAHSDLCAIFPGVRGGTEVLLYRWNPASPAMTRSPLELQR